MSVQKLVCPPSSIVFTNVDVTMYYSPRQSFDQDCQYRLARLQTGRHRLLNHPLIQNAPSSSLSPRLDRTEGHPFTQFPQSSGSITREDTKSCHARIKELYRQVMRSEVGIDVDHPSFRLGLQDHIRSVQATCPRPSLSDTKFRRALAGRHSASVLSDKSILAHVAPRPLSPPVPTPSSLAVSSALQKRREEASASHRSAGKTALLSNNLSPEEAKLPDASAFPETPLATSTCVLPPARRTRSSLYLQNSSRLPRAPEQPLCCFCPSDRAHLPPPQISGVGAGKTDRPDADGVGANEKGVAEKLNDNSIDMTLDLTKQGEMLGPFSNPKSIGGKRLYVHFECACWAPQVYTDPDTNQLHRVHEEYQRGRQLRCSQCFHRGATVGCYVHQCKKVFHYRCLDAAGAYKVRRFFVAFCDVHAHLANKSSYKILMEAATIADVAASRRSKDATQGLDAPHSRFTKLRRMETEIVFSRKWKVTSVPTTFDNDMVIFSHKRRAIFRRSDRYSLGDGLRALRVSALEVASGRLAYMAIMGRRDPPSKLSPVEARAVLASKDNTGVFLLRNLRRSPEWQKGSLCVIKSSFHWDKLGTGPNFSPGQIGTQLKNREWTDGLLWGDRYNGSGERVLLVSPEEPKEPTKKQRGRPKRKTSNTPSNSSCKLSDIDGPSVPLPAFKKPKLALMTKRNDERAPSTIPDDRERLLSEMGLSGRVLSSWETFLAEQLPRERVLRPGDSMDDSMRNMARLWSLMTVAEREEYERRAAEAASLASTDDKLATDHGIHENDGKFPNIRSVGRATALRVRSIQTVPSAREIGLFSSAGLQPDSGRVDNVEAVRNSSVNISKSLSLPRGGKRLSQKRPSEGASMCLDEMFPITADDLTPASENVAKPLINLADIPVERVRSPPPRRSK